MNRRWQAGDLDWDDLRVFAAVARAANLSRGARDARVDRSTASRRIAALEEALGARLFLRTREGLRLSPAGDRVLGHAEQMASEARALRLSANDGGVEAARGVVRIATTEALAAMLVRRGLLEIGVTHPGLQIELLGANRVVDLARGEADLALRVTKVEQSSLRVRRVARLPFSAVAGEPYVRRRGAPRSERDLAGHDVLLHTGELATLPEARWLGSRPGVRVVLRTNSMIALLAGIAAGAGISVIAGSSAEQELGLVRLFDVAALPPRPLFLAMHPDAATRAAVRVVAEHVAAIVAGTRTA
ncbi:MAG TPA: LysR family transcriptional regulator [Polyangiaceae bacterium]|nr:LysR family transcriptional regulator [Polyangiaceae bacterium]